MLTKKKKKSNEKNPLRYGRKTKRNGFYLGDGKPRRIAPYEWITNVWNSSLVEQKKAHIMHLHGIAIVLPFDNHENQITHTLYGRILNIFMGCALGCIENTETVKRGPRRNCWNFLKAFLLVPSQVWIFAKKS